MKFLTGAEMEITQGLTKEGFQVYHIIRDQLTNVDIDGGRTARAARLDAILFARHADIVADIISKKTGKKYTALDYMRERYGLNTTGKNVGDLAQSMSDTALVRLQQDQKAWNNLIDEYEKSDKNVWKKYNNGKLYDLMKIPLVLQLLHVPYDDIKVYGSFFQHSLRASHPGMTTNLLRQLPASIADPVMVLRGNKPDSYVFVLELKTDKGASVVAPVEINKLDERRGIK